ncbi:MAG: SusC/RagA family TonB-linked outer membrane protein [Bacteroidota bacterium]
MLIKSHFIWLSLCCCLFSSILLAQQNITGKIIDGTTQEALVGVSVFCQETNTGVVTNIDGKYEINLPANAQNLLFSFVGYESTRIAIENKTTINVSLQAGVALSEVLVTALGLKRSSKALGYAVQQLEQREIDEVKAVNFLDNLTGKVAGVTITAGSTGLGSTSKISIRGESSFTNNNPLFVVDGIPINNNTVVNITNDAAAGFQEVDFGNGAMEVNPSDIESVSVLKGPSAAALYGSRASNGVIIINTKDGASGEGLGISFNSTTYVEQAFQLPQFQNTYGQGNSGAFEFVNGLGGGVNDNITFSYGPRLDAGLLIPQYDSPVTLPDGRVVRGGDIAVHGGLPITPTPFTTQPDNVNNFYETGLTTINNIAFAGAYDRGNYRLSLTDVNSNSIIPGVNLKRKTAAAKLLFQPIEQLKVTTSFNYINSQSDNRPNNGYGSENVNYDLTAWLGRQTNLEPLRDYWQPGLEDIQHFSFNYTFFDNPYFILFENRNSFNRDRVFGHLAASYQFNAQWSLSLRSGMDYSDEQRAFRRAFSTNRFSNGGYAENDVFFREINTDFLLNYKNQWGDFALDVSFGGNRMDQQAATSQVQALSLAQPGVFRLSNAASPLEIFEQTAEKRINSLYGLAKLSYKQILFLDLSGRNDWSSALATPTSTDNTSFFYPSASLSFVVSQAVELPEVISFAQLRSSWAQVGNDTDPYRTSGVFIAQTPYNSQPTFSDQNSLPNTNLLPEQTSSIELGADIRFFDDRFTIDLSYYNALTENQILALPIAQSTGYEERVLNGGSVRAEGWEAVIGLNPVRRKYFRWNSTLNFSRNVATVESLPDEAERLTLAYSRVYDNLNQTVWFQVREGDQIGDLWGTGYLKNEQGDFVITEEGRYIVDNSLKKLGNYNPDFILGFSNQFHYKNISLSFLIDWRQGGELVSRTLALAGTSGQLEETEFRPEEGIIAEGVVNTGTADNPNYVSNTTAIPAESYYRQFYDRNHEENNVYDATYVKLRELSIRYQFSKKQLQGSFLRAFENLHLALVGRNLFALSEIPHFDPEQLAAQGPNFVSGVEDMAYPTSRSIGINIGLAF